MKHKFLSMMATACAALFTIAGLTGCGGGGDSETYGVVTLNDFNGGRKGFKIAYGAGMMEIQPVTGGEELETDQQNPDLSNDYRTGTSTKSALINGKYTANVVYYIPSWVAGPQNADGTPGPMIPGTGTTLTISFSAADVATASVDANLLLAIGAIPESDRLIDSIKIDLDYANKQGSLTSTVSYKDGNGNPMTATVTPNGSFYVVRY